MMSKDSVKNRLETGLSFTEFSYQLLQAYDFQCLYTQNNCEFQIGGSDQWGNITSGTEFIRRNVDDGKAFAITTPLLTKSDGSKFGKSSEGNLWMDPEMTSPYKFYQFWINADDADLPKYLRYFSYKTKEQVEGLEQEYANDPKSLKKILADELTRRIHSDEACDSAIAVSDILFEKNATAEQLGKLPEADLEIIAGEIPSFKFVKQKIQNGLSIASLMAEETKIVKSNGEARRAVQNNAVSINKEKVSDFNAIVTTDMLLHGKYLMLENGKKNKYLVEFA